MDPNVDVSQLPYRDSVSCILFKDDGYLLVQSIEWTDDMWKFPQGGVEEGESEEDTIYRELKEELNIDNIKILQVSSYKNKYDWSPESLKLAGYRWRGQIQKFYLVEFLGTDDDIKVDPTEVSKYKWVELEDLFESIEHDNQNFTNYKNTIEKVLAEFNRL